MKTLKQLILENPGFEKLTDEQLAIEEYKDEIKTQPTYDGKQLRPTEFYSLPELAKAHRIKTVKRDR